MNIYFDTEFTGLVPGTTLISMGAVADSGEKFYAEFTDYDKSLVDDWIKSNVIDTLIFNKNGAVASSSKVFGHIKAEEFLGGDLFTYGNSEIVRENLLIWLNQFPIYRGYFQFISDVGHYDMMLLCNLFGGARKLPDRISPVLYDICQDICARKELRDDEGKLIYSRYADPQYMKYAFNLNREKLLSDNGFNLPSGKKHNALYDAEVIKAIYEGIQEGE